MLQLLVVEEKRIARATLMEAVGRSADLPSGAAAGCSSGGAWSSDGAVNR